MADNFGSSFSDAFAQQQKIGIAEKQQQFEQEFKQKALVESNIKSTLDVAGQIAKAAAAAGKDPAAIAAAIQPLIDSAAELSNGVHGPSGAARVRQVGASLTQVAPDTTAGTSTPTPAAPPSVPAQPPLTQSDVITPSQVAQANPTLKDRLDQSFGALPQMSQAPEDAALPAGATPVQSTANLKSSEIPIGSAKTRTMIENGIINRKNLDFRAELWILDQNSAKGVARGKEGAAITNAVIDRGAEIADARGIKPGEVLAQGALTGSSRKALDQIVKVSNAIETFENTAIKNGDLLVQLAKKADATGIPVVERYLRPARQLAGDTDVSNFKTQMVLWRAEVAKILTNPNLTGVLTDEARREVGSAIREDSSFQQIQKANALLKRDFENRSNANKEQIDKIMNSFSDRGGSKPVQQKPAVDLQRLKEKYGLK